MTIGRFVVGFAIGAAAGTAIVLIVTPKSGVEMMNSVHTRLKNAFDEGRTAASSHEQELWDGFRTRLQEKKNGNKNGESGSPTPPMLPLDLPT